MRRILDEGDRDAYGEIVRRYQERLYWTAYRLLGHHEDARDVTQETFVRAYRNLRSFDRKRRFHTWAYRILTNLAVDRMRARSRWKRAPFPGDIADPSPGPRETMLGEELREEVRATLEELPPRYRALLVLRDLEGISGKQISEATGVSHATVRWRIHRARRLFREAWERRRERRER